MVRFSRRLLAALVRRRRYAVAGDLAADLSTFAFSPWSFQTDESAAGTFTARDTNNAVMPGVPVTLAATVEKIAVGTCTLECLEAEIPDNGTTVANFVAHYYDSAGDPCVGLDDAQCGLASTGSNNTITKIDSATNADGRFRFTLASTTAETKTCTASFNGANVTDTAQVVVDGTPPAGLTPVLQVKFGTTGTSNAVVLGTGETYPFQQRGGTGGTVMSAAGLDFPTTNVLRVTWLSSDGWTFIRANTLPEVTSGTNRNYRWYVRSVWPNGTADSETHPMQDGFSAPETNWMFKMLNRTDAWRPSLWAGNGRQAYPNNNWTADALSLAKDATYRVEVQFVRVSSSTYRLHVWIYNSSGVLQADDSDFYQTDSGSVLLSTNPLFTGANTLTTANQALVGFNGGCNDTGGEAGSFAYEGAFAVVDGLAEDVQIGAYGSVTGET